MLFCQKKLWYYLTYEGRRGYSADCPACDGQRPRRGVYSERFPRPGVTGGGRPGAVADYTGWAASPCGPRFVRLPANGSTTRPTHAFDRRGRSGPCARNREPGASSRRPSCQYVGCFVPGAGADDLPYGWTSTDGPDRAPRDQAETCVAEESRRRGNERGHRRSGVTICGSGRCTDTDRCGSLQDVQTGSRSACARSDVRVRVDAPSPP